MEKPKLHVMKLACLLGLSACLGWMVACPAPVRWSPVGGCEDPVKHPALGDAFSQGRESLFACLRLGWGQQSGALEGAETTLVKLQRSGQLLDPQSSDEPIRIRIPTSVSSQSRYFFSVFVLGKGHQSQSLGDLQSMCTGFSKEYQCAPDPKGDCWFALHFNGKRAEGQAGGAKPAPATCSMQTPPDRSTEPLGKDARASEPQRPEPPIAAEPSRPDEPSRPTEPPIAVEPPRPDEPPTPSEPQPLPDEPAPEPQTEPMREAIPDRPVVQTSWASKGGTTSFDRGLGLAVDGAGNSFVVGQLYRPASSNPAATTAAFSPLRKKISVKAPLFVAKADASGAWKWLALAESGGDSEANGVVVGAKGEVFVAGCVGPVPIFGTLKKQVNGSRFLFVAGLSPTGSWQWAELVEVTGGCANALALGPGGDLFVAGAFLGKASFGATKLSNSGESPFVARLSLNPPKWIWAIQAQNSDSFNPSRALGVAVDARGDVLVAGYFIGSTQFQSLQKPNSFKAGFAAKLKGSDGSWMWNTFVNPASPASASFEGLAVDAQGGIYVGGTLRDGPSFGRFKPSTASGPAAFVAKLDSNGKWLWLADVSATAISGLGLASDPQGTTYLTGNFQGAAAFGSTTLNSKARNSDIFVAGLDAKGKWLWAKRAGGGAYDFGRAVAVGKAGLSVTGEFQGDSKTSADFDSVQLTGLVTDIFLWSLKP